MTTKDYKLIARALRKSFNRKIEKSLTFPTLGGMKRLADYIVDDLVDELEKDNPRFNSAEFTKVVWS